MWLTSSEPHEESGRGLEFKVLQYENESVASSLWNFINRIHRGYLHRGAAFFSRFTGGILPTNDAQHNSTDVWDGMGSDGMECFVGTLELISSCSCDTVQCSLTVFACDRMPMGVASLHLEEQAVLPSHRLLWICDGGDSLKCGIW